MSGPNLIDYAQFIGKDIPKKYAEIYDHFNIEISIPMRKPKNHYSKAPSVVWNFLNTFEAGTFFPAQGYWESLQEPVTYVMISTEGLVKNVVGKLTKLLRDGQIKLKQKEMFVKINGRKFSGSLVPDEIAKTFPNQMAFDDDMAEFIRVNQSRVDENHKLIFGRAELHRGKRLVVDAKSTNDEKNIIRANDKALIHYIESYNIFSDLEEELLQKPETLSNKRDLLKCYSNVLDPKTRQFMKDDEIKYACQELVNLLPLNQKSEFEKELSKHAEARIRGNRINILIGIEYEIVSKQDLHNDGVFAFKQIISFLNPEDKNTPYLDKDPINDLKNIIRQIKKIGLEIDLFQDLAKEIECLRQWFPHYKEDIEDLVRLF